ncbi:unnamed protein product [Closterium sp. NIES-53]
MAPGGPNRGAALRGKRREYKAVMKVSEGRKPVFGGCFNTIDPRYLNMFASVSGNRITVYKCEPGGATIVVQLFLDENKDESFYTVAWMRGQQGRPLLAASGSSGVIRIIDCWRETVVHSFIGHGGAVNEVRVHPSHPALLLSAGKDESLRLWNTDTGVCVAIMGGTDGHRNEVLSADFHPGDQAIIASCGMDSSIRVWSLQECWHVVNQSNTWADVPSKFPTKILQYPLYVVCDVHTNYIDCLRWYGDFVLSKSVDNEVILWRWCHKPATEPGSTHPAEGTLDILQRYPVPDCGFWFIKFDLDYMASIMAIGNCVGKVYVYDLQSSPPILLSTLSRKDCKTQIRQTAVSHDGRIIMSCDDDGWLWRWDLVMSHD